MTGYEWIDVAAQQIVRKLLPLMPADAYKIAEIIRQSYDQRISYAMQVKQTPTTGLGGIIGKWPGDESDEEIQKALEELS